MGLTPNFSRNDIHSVIQKKLQTWEKAVLNTLFYLGEQCVNIGRSTNTYRDQTGNLRNSIGYLVLKYGVVVRSNFRPTAQITVAVKGNRKFRSTRGGLSGAVAGLAMAKRLAAEYAQGYVLIVVAGMNYAVSVESRGLDVLTSAEQEAKTELPKLLRSLKLDAQAR
ncbi:hypothetical protein [Spirosoma pollinicola]|uniref:Uncharacterized protein n=1 Tax=Spirosoma pollinicola TaxID=2057025 RepID=A0A2K8YTJ7_9BACT|nr:hypothetical protein [Spirosoma pollinicola]AUD00937.1 hypothetical protein CWM47_03365 [Spirosoma pollinicola]